VPQHNKSLEWQPVYQLPVAAEDIVQTTVCEVTADPAKFNHKLIELTGTATEDMERFSLWDGECHHDKNNYTSIWLEYGGRKRSGAKYCCNQPLDRERTVSLVVEGFATATIDDKAFRAFDARVYPRGSTRARLIGRFLPAHARNFQLVRTSGRVRSLRHVYFVGDSAGGVDWS
jgi:hypothetical protein